MFIKVKTFWENGTMLGLSRSLFNKITNSRALFGQVSCSKAPRSLKSTDADQAF